MNDIQMFLSNQIDSGSINKDDIVTQPNAFSSTFCSIGDFCLSPVKVITNGSSIHIKLGKIGDNSTPITVVTGAQNKSSSVISTIISVILLAPSVIIGGAFKALAYIFSAELRENHRIAIKHFDPSMRGLIVVGSDGKRLSENELASVIKEIPNKLELQTNSFKHGWWFHLNYQHVGLVLYTDPKTVISKDPGFSRDNHSGILKESISKLIIVGGRLITEQEAEDEADKLRKYPETSIHTVLRDNYRFEHQQKHWDASYNSKSIYILNIHHVKNLAEALADPLGYDMDHSWTKKVYVVQDHA